MKLRCRMFGHDTYGYRTNLHTAAYLGPPEITLVSVCRRCGNRDMITVPDGASWTVLPDER
jgi:hypothetical protein